MARTLDTFTLRNYARQFSVWWIQGYLTGRPEHDKEWLKKEFYSFHYKDEFEFLIDAVRARLKGEDLDSFEKAIKDLNETSPRSDKVFEEELDTRMAIDKDGVHIPGKTGKVIVGSRIVGKRVDKQGIVRDAVWPVYMGEDEEREAGNENIDPLPTSDHKLFIEDEHLQLVKK